jgi:DNA-directed RNA polymerase subunit RPC12/RpoP
VARSAAQSPYSVVCPHCGKEFEGELLVGSETPESRGFKCPHCRLFVPLERTDASPDASK